MFFPVLITGVVKEISIQGHWILEGLFILYMFDFSSSLKPLVRK